MASSRLHPAVTVLAVADVLLLVLVVVLGLTYAARSGDAGAAAAAVPSSTSPSATSPAPPSEDPSASPEPPAVSAPPDALDLAQFQLPSGNIWCDLSENGATCQIKEHTYSPPSRPGCQAEAYGAIITVGSDAAQMPCPEGQIAGGTPLALPTLEYDQQTFAAGFLCASSKAGVACRNLATSHGFTLARGGYATF